MNVMRNLRIDKVTLNIGAGKDQSKLEKGVLLLKEITGVNPVKTFTQKRIPEWGLRPGLAIGCKITLRKKKADEILERFLEAKDKVLSENQFDSNGNLSFGIAEYIDIPGVKYDPKIGIMGLQICVTIERPGFRIKRRFSKTVQIHPRHKVTKSEAIEFIKNKFKVTIKSGEE